MESEEAILREIIIKIGGKGSEALVPILISKSNLDEFKLAEKAKMTINQLRNVLYKLHANDLVSFTRKKDKKKGWYIYFWTLNKPKALKYLLEHYGNERKQLENFIEVRQKKNYFICSNCHIELNEESALEQNFECVECGELLVLKDDRADIKKISKDLEELDKRITHLRGLVSKFELPQRKAKMKEKIKKFKKKGKFVQKAKSMKSVKKFKKYHERKAGKKKRR